MEIVYEDNSIIICNKPAGVASQSDKTFETDLLSSVMTYRQEHEKDSYAAIINRLDKPVGGLALFAKDKKTAASLSALSGEHSIHKYYFAVVKGVLDNDKGEFNDYLLKDANNNVSRVVKEGTAGAKKAALLYECLDKKDLDGETYSLMKIRLLTGRHHQIRVQFAAHGHPLYGDLKYNLDFKDKRGVMPALFAYRISFKNPYGADEIAVEVMPEGKSWDFEYFNVK